jgi:large subunit ribosomal protein L23
MIDLIKYPVITEKSCLLIEENKYTFDVDKNLTKPQIKKILENLFKINIISVNTHLPPIKKKRLGLKQGYKARYKRVIITVKSNQQIPIFGIEKNN